MVLRALKRGAFNRSAHQLQRPLAAASPALELKLPVEDYEGKHLPIYPPDPLAAIRFRMEQLDLDRKALEPSIGSRARVSEVLSGRRRLTLDMIRRLHRQLGIPAEVLLAS